MEWEASLEVDKPTLKLYDEPDANLHYSAQKQIATTIFNDVTDNLNVQIIMCTHSITVLDRIPINSVIQVSRNDGKSDCNFFNYGEEFLDIDKEVKDFYLELSYSLGYPSSSLLLEKVFLLVEGPSEINALPILYRKYTGRSYREDGIVLINLETNGGWKPLLKFLGTEKSNFTYLFLDSDTQYPESTAMVTKERLEEIGFDSTFIDQQTVFTGTKEFEDTFHTLALLRTMNINYPRIDNLPWTDAHLHMIQQSGNKFSDALRKAIGEFSRQNVGKPEIAQKFALQITPDEILEMTDIVSLFNKISNLKQDYCDH